MAKLKGFLKFRLKDNQSFDVFGEGFPPEDPDQVKLVSILRDENGLPIPNEYVEWEGATGDTQGPKKLKLSGKPKKKRADGSVAEDKLTGDLIGDLIGDLTVTVQWGDGPTHSLSISQVVYEP